MYSSNAISEIIPTIQCEIKIGEPVIMVRLNGCNLNCEWCDTKYTWKKNNEIELTDTDINAINEIHNQYPNIDTLMITGGEPLLYANQDKFYELLNLENFSIIHIETNGMLLNTKNFHIDNWTAYTIINISPKIEYLNKNNLLDEYISELKKFVYHQWINHPYLMDVNLKFVYYHQIEQDILKFIDAINTEFGYKKIYIMSRTPNLTKINENDINDILRKNDFETIKFCMKYGVMFTPRFHTYLFHGNRNEMINK